MSVSSSGRFTGWHMLAIMVGGFGIVIAVNLLMAREAITTFGGLVVENSYVASQHFNRWLDEAEKEKELGWKVSLARKPDGKLVVMTQGVPTSVTVRGDAWHPLGRMPDQPLQFDAAGAGSFVSTAALPAGRWLIRLELSSGAQKWRYEEALQ